MKHTIYACSFFIAFFMTSGAFAQGLSVNTTGAAAHSSAILDASSTTKGMLAPRMTAAAKNAISSPATGLLVYQTDGIPGFYCYTGAAWIAISTPTGSAGGDLTGTYPNPAISSSAGNNIVTAINASSSTINIDRLSSSVTAQSNTFNGASQLVRLDFTGKLPMVDGSQLTGLNFWSKSGNSLTATGTFGTTSPNHIDLMTGGTVRGRLTNQGEFFLGTTSTVATGDLMAAQGNVLFPFALSGYTSYSGSGVYGAVQGGGTEHGGVEGAYMGTGYGSGVNGNNEGSGPGAGVQGMYIGSAASNTSPTGVYGFSNPSVNGNQRIGVLGNYSSDYQYGIGVAGFSYGGVIPAGNNDIAVLGWRTNNSNYASYFNGNTTVTNGTKSASVGTSKGNQLLYCMEAPEIWFEDIGSAQLTSGQAVVHLDPLFLETVLIDAQHPMHVFLQAEGECNELYVIPGTTSFKVVEKGGGTSNAPFSYRITAKRLHFADHRFGSDPVWGPGDTRKYNTDAVPRPQDYARGVKFDEEMKKNPPAVNYPEGFIKPTVPQAATRKMKQ